MTNFNFDVIFAAARRFPCQTPRNVLHYGEFESGGNDATETKRDFAHHFVGVLLCADEYVCALGGGFALRAKEFFPQYCRVCICGVHFTA